MIFQVSHQAPAKTAKLGSKPWYCCLKAFSCHQDSKNLVAGGEKRYYQQKDAESLVFRLTNMFLGYKMGIFPNLLDFPNVTRWSGTPLLISKHPLFSFFFFFKHAIPRTCSFRIFSPQVRIQNMRILRLEEVHCMLRADVVSFGAAISACGKALAWRRAIKLFAMLGKDPEHRWPLPFMNIDDNGW